MCFTFISTIPDLFDLVFCLRELLRFKLQPDSFTLSFVVSYFIHVICDQYCSLPPTLKFPCAMNLGFNLLYHVLLF